MTLREPSARHFLLTIVAILGLADWGVCQSEPVVWVNPVNVTVSTNNLTKSAGGTAWNAGAASAQIIGAGSGYVEFTATEANTWRACGLSFGDTDQTDADIDFGLVLTLSGALAAIQPGGDVSLGTYAAGDRLRVEVQNGAVQYRKNGVLLYTSTAAVRYPLRVDSSLLTPGATLTDVRIGTIVWKNEVGVVVSGSRLTKTGGTSGFNAGAVSALSLDSGDGVLEFSPPSTPANLVIGLGVGDSGQSETDVEFGLHLRADTTFEVLEAGAPKGNFGVYAAGDRFRVQVANGAVEYLLNGALFYTSATAPTYPLRVDTSFDTPGGSVNDVLFDTLAVSDVDADAAVRCLG